MSNNSNRPVRRSASMKRVVECSPPQPQRPPKQARKSFTVRTESTREQHNALERMRRLTAKEQFRALYKAAKGHFEGKENFPPGKMPSRTKLLYGSADYIRHLKRKTSEDKNRSEKEYEEKKRLEYLIAQLESGKNPFEGSSGKKFDLSLLRDDSESSNQ